MKRVIISLSDERSRRVEDELKNERQLAMIELIITILRTNRNIYVN